MKGKRVRFNVGGKKFETTATTLAFAGADSFFGSLLSDDWITNTTNDEDDEVFIDRNPDCFAVILDLLRTGELSIPPRIGKDSLIREAQFYGVLELVRAASWASPLNGDFLLPSSSINCRAKKSVAKMIFGSPNGGFCVANDSSVLVYDWMLHEHPPIHLDYGKVKDALWVGTNNIAIATTKSIGMFDAATGKLQYKFVDQNGKQISDATSMCLGDSNIFYPCPDDDSAIGMLDLESEKSIGSLHLQLPGVPSNKVRSNINLQIVDGSSSKSLLLATSAVSQPGFTGEEFEARIFDTRDKVHSRSWSSKNYTFDNRVILGSTVMEGRNSICLISTGSEVGFLDLRFAEDVQWRSRKFIGQHSFEEPVKLAYQNDRIFMFSVKLVVFSVPDLVLTEKIPIEGGSCGGSSIIDIDDFSVSGDRLFMLQSRTNLVEVWETPRPCLAIL